MKSRSIAQLAAVSMLALSAVVMLNPTSTALGAHDGRTSDTAAASCWEIHQQNPAAPSGRYWIVTPAMAEPVQVFCDQEMDGGGWTLVGRGREGWDLYPQGKGAVDDLATRERGPQALDTIQMPNQRIDELLNYQPVRTQEDGFRILRAADTDGTTFQSVDIRPYKMGRWQWAFKSVDGLSYRFDNGVWRNGGTFTRGFGTDNAWHHVNMGKSSNRSYLLGYAYGPNIGGGSTSSSSFWWQNNSSVLPYSEVYIRPRLTSDDPGFTRIPDEGSAAVSRTAVASDMAASTRWGVVGNLNGSHKEGNGPVQTFAQIGNVMFIGGNFTGVQAGKNGQTHPRTALAAFDATTGEWLPDFNVTFDNQVKALVVTPDGHLLAGGDFAHVNGEKHTGTVLLNPTTGEIIPSWDLQIDNRLRRGVVSVRSMTLAGDHVYLGGTFTHLSGRGVKNSYARAIGRVDLTGRPDRYWNPELNGGVMSVDASVDEGRVYAAGFFTRAASPNPAKYAAVISTDTGAPVIPFDFQGSHSIKNYQQAVAHTGTLVFFGGSEHNMFGYAPDSLTRVSASITNNDGGDIQALATDGQVVYAGCHCFGWSYENSSTWPNVGNQWTNTYKVQGLGAWNATDGTQIPWVPYRLASKNAGAWALKVADDGALWVGGDFTGSHTSMTRSQWNGGFVRYPAGDTTPPPTPSPLWAEIYDAETITLQWGGVLDADHYQVLRDDRPIASTTETRLTIPRGGDDRYFVRAVDAAGNISASTPVFQAPPGNDNNPPAPTPQLLIGDAAEWKYYAQTAAPDSRWKDVDFDDASWDEGPAALGYGSSGLGTSWTPLDGAARPITTYFRHSFTVEDPTQVAALLLTYVADDGAVVYLNGYEVSRERMPQGPIGHTTRAHLPISATQAMASPVQLRLSADQLRPGENVLAVETHINYRMSRTLTFKGKLISEPVGAPQDEGVNDRAFNLQDEVAVDEAPSDTPASGATPADGQQSADSPASGAEVPPAATP